MTRACKRPDGRRDGGRRTPGKDEPEYVRVASYRSSTRAGISATVQIVSLRNAWLPRPSAKNEYRQLSCSIARQGQSQREEGQPGRAAKQRSRDEHDGSGRQATCGRAGAAWRRHAAMSGCSCR